MAGRFYDYEGTRPALDSRKRDLRQYGIPQGVYLEKHTTGKTWAQPTIDEERADQRPRSQCEQSVAALGIAGTHANSPQATGRVERLFRTLQDRLVRELRWRGIKSVAEANAVLQHDWPTYNRRFRRPAAALADLPRSCSRELDRLRCIRVERTVKNNCTIAHHGALYQLTQVTRAQKVTGEERLDGTLPSTDRGPELRYRALAVRPTHEAPDPPRVRHAKKPWTPPTDHPWRRLWLPKRRTKGQSVAAS